METPPPHTQAHLGVGVHLRERELGPRDHVTCYVIARSSQVAIPGWRGGEDPPRDTSFTGGELRALGLIGS